MKANKKNNFGSLDVDFADFEGTDVGAAEIEKWQWPGIGYNSSEGVFYIDEDQITGLTFVPLAIRQCKEVEDINGATHRYPIFTRRGDMADPAPGTKVVNRAQVAVMVDGELYNFGMRSWTARAGWLNPRSGAYREEKFETGLWYRLEDYIMAVKQQKGKPTTPLCWQLSIGASEEVFVMGTGKNTSKAHAIVLTGGPEFVGAERVAEYAALYESEDIAGWVDEWKQTAVEEAQNDLPPVELGDTPEDDLEF